MYQNIKRLTGPCEDYHSKNNEGVIGDEVV